MTATPARLLKPLSDACPSCPPLSLKDQRRRAHMLEAARDMFTTYGFRTLTIPQFAYSTGYSQVAIRRQYGDLENLLSLVLLAYLDTILKAVGEIRAGAEDLFPRRRSAYFQATRTFRGTPTAMHYLLLQDRFALPPDALETIETHRSMIAQMLGGEHADAAITFLDTAMLTQDQIEAALAAITQPQPHHDSRPEPAAQAAPQPETLHPEHRDGAAQPPTLPAATLPTRKSLFSIQHPELLRPNLQNPSLQRPGLQRPDLQRPDLQHPESQHPHRPAADLPTPHRLSSAPPRANLPRPEPPPPEIRAPLQATTAHSPEPCKFQRMTPDQLAHSIYRTLDPAFAGLTDEDLQSPAQNGTQKPTTPPPDPAAAPAQPPTAATAGQAGPPAGAHIQRATDNPPPARRFA